MRRAARVDSNHAAIVAALRAAGCSVQSLASVGGGVPDLLVGRAGRNYLLEVKDGGQPESRRRLTTHEAKWRDGWRGQWAVAHDALAAVDVVNARLEPRGNRVGSKPLLADIQRKTNDNA